MRFDDRRAAGRQLSWRLESLRDRDPVVLGLPRGGAPVAYEGAGALDAPLDGSWCVNGECPGRRSSASSRSGRTASSSSTPTCSKRPGSVTRNRRSWKLPSGPDPGALTGRTVVIVDDGLATDAAAEAGGQVVRGRGAARMVLTVPVGPTSVVARLRRLADEVVCLQAQPFVGAVGAWYQTSDTEVTALLA
ncbi:phosphoribosyltransferase family protein [Streptomyces pseudovenezuelae]|uniref:phosphoribosyltransferase n=1 Tax=Streptomyces pseudovenezuelae TaxID=67350 RepID=UPI002E36843A|nr:phosphoribosyltransferase family protein [Streptomyces pseudovenezuelae]